MKKFHEIYSELQQDMDKESVVLYKMLAKKFGSEKLYMGVNRSTKKPVIFDNREVVKVNLETVIENWFTKINHIGIEKRTGFGRERVLIKGWVVGRRRYRLKFFEDLTPIEKINVLQYMNNLI